jgi:5-methylcytosine-specific restriction endonuclease McrA
MQAARARLREAARGLWMVRTVEGRIRATARAEARRLARERWQAEQEVLAEVRQRVRFVEHGQAELHRLKQRNVRLPLVRGLRGQGVHYDEVHDRLYPGGSTFSPEWRALRTAVYERDLGTCQACLAPGREVDHKLPLSKGGRNELSNLWLLCRPCHVRKTARRPRSR